MTNLKDYINDFGKKIEDLGLNDLLTTKEYEAQYKELLDDCMDSIKNLFGFE